MHKTPNFLHICKHLTWFVKKNHISTIGKHKITCLHALFRNKKFMLDEMTRQNASKFVIFYINENTKLFFLFFLSCYIIFPLFYVDVHRILISHFFVFQQVLLHWFHIYRTKCALWGTKIFYNIWNIEYGISVYVLAEICLQWSKRLGPCPFMSIIFFNETLIKFKSHCLIFYLRKLHKFQSTAANLIHQLAIR